MKLSSLLVLVCALLSVALVAAETETLVVAAEQQQQDLDFAAAAAVDADAEAEADAEEDEAEAEAEDESESEAEAEAEDEEAEEAEAEAEDDVFVALQEAAAAKTASNAEADTELSEAFDRIVQHQIEQTDAAEAAAAAEDLHLSAAASAAVESTLAAAHISVPAVLNAAADESADESSLVEADAAAEVVLDVDADLGAELEAAAANEQVMDQWLDAEMGSESEAEAEGPLDADAVDALIADAPALPREAVKIVAPKPKKPVSKKVAKKIAAKKREERRAAIAAGKPVPKKSLAKKKAAVPFIDPRVVRKWKNIKETTIAYLRAVRKHVKSKYGTSSAALVAGGVKATREVYTICLKYGRNKFLCAVLRDLFLKNYVRADVDLFAKKTGKRFVRENMKKIIKFTHHHVRHPHEFTGEYMNQKYLVDPFNTCPKRMGREIRKFLRALRYAVTEKHPDLTHELVEDFNTVFATAKKRCAKLQSAVEFTHPLCDVLLRVLNKKFATKDVFLDRQVRTQFVRVVKKRVKRARAAERKAKGLPKIDPLCDPKGAAKAERKVQKELKKKAAEEKLAAQAAALAAPAAPAAAPAAAAAAAAPAAAPAAAAAEAEKPRRHSGLKGRRHDRKSGSGSGRRGSRGKGKGNGNGSKSRSNLLYSKINAAVTKDRYEITIRLNLDYNTVARTPEDLEAFIKTFAADTSRSLGVTSDRISVTAVQAADSGAGINVKFLILPDASAPNGASDPKNANSVDAVADKFAAQTQDSKSTLMQSPILSKLAGDSQVSLTKQQTMSTGKSAAPASAVVSAALVALLSLVALVAARV